MAMSEDPTNRYTRGEHVRRNPEWGENVSEWKSRQILTMMGRHNLTPESICDAPNVTIM